MQQKSQRFYCQRMHQVTGRDFRKRLAIQSKKR